ncbi:MAG: glycerol-3-phosphate 1-O-acyltransferase PlsB [Proteobacteria bacterium]|nr:glycerol-3-phosphate 1-O-acyltransferase PlsB [Pseudomonadota bacterium]
MSPVLGLGRSLLWLAGRVMGLWVRPTPLPVDEAERLRGRGRRVLYVLERQSLSDLLALALVCRAVGLPPATRRFVLGAAREPRASLFLERRRGWLRKRADRRTPERLQRLIAAALAAGDCEVDLVPVAVFWGRTPLKTEGSWLRQLVREDWTLVGPFRRFLSTLVNGRRTLVRFGDPVSLAEFVGAEPEARRAARRAVRVMRAEFRNARAAVVGPDLSHRRTVIAEVLAKRAVRAAVALEIRDKRLSRREGLLQARRYALEIAADYSPGFVALMEGILARVWNRLYDGVEVLHAERLELASAGAQIVYVPCHRSHMDYLLLSYVIYKRGFAVPHVAGGVNLDLPVVGRYLRKGGAFFLRRTFRGNPVYPIVFMTYLGVMMARGHPIEYFIEGGRSRTGRLLAPKTGMLAMTLRSFLADPSRPVLFMPVYFGYERLVEAKTYVGELSGRPKQKESVLGLLRSLGVLRKRFGRVFVSFGEPIPLAEILTRVAPGWQQSPVEVRPPWLGAATDALAAEIQSRVNAAAAISPIALLSLALLSAPRQAMPEADLVRQLDLYRRLAERAPYSADVWCTPLDGTAIVAYGHAMGVIETVAHPLGAIVRMSEESAVLSAYYRNNIVHAFAFPSLIACAFLNNPAMRTEDVQRLAWRIYPYIAQELFLRWPEAEVAGVVDEMLAALAELGLLERSADGTLWRRPRTGTAAAVQLSLLAHATLDVIERYYLAIALLLQAGHEAISQDALESRCQQMASRMALLYELRAPEFFDRTLFRQFLDLLRARNVIRTVPGGRLSYDEELLRVAADAQLVLSEQIRHSILQVTAG